MTTHNGQYIAALSEKIGRELTKDEIIGALDCLAHEAKLDRDAALARINLAAKYLTHHHMIRPGIAAIVQLLTMPEKP